MLMVSLPLIILYHLVVFICQEQADIKWHLKYGKCQKK